MRIATSTLTNLTTNATSGAYANYMDIIAKIAANKNFTKVSENVADASKVLKLNNQLAQLDEYQSNIQAATNEMNLTYDTLGDIADEISNINSLVVQASNGTTTPESAKAIASEIKERVETITDKLNTKYMDNYIFSGTYVQQPAYVKNAAGDIVYQGSSQKSGDRKLTISENTAFTYNYTGEEIFGKQDGSGADFFSQMKDLCRLLEEPTLDYDAIRSKLDIIDSTDKKVIQTQGDVSSKVSKLASTKAINDKTIISLTENKVNLEEVDITKAAGELASAQTALQASYLLGTNVLRSVSLLDYL